jgi:phospholipase C
MSGNLATVTYLVPQDQLTEHPPKRPRDGGWQQREIIDALVNSPSYKDSALFITYDGEHHFMTTFLQELNFNLFRRCRIRRILYGLQSDLICL